MQDRPTWLPEHIDLEKPSAARCYDYFLGGSHNFESDRELARRVEEAVPGIRPLAQNNRAFLRRLVRYCMDRGIRQFLDIGSGIPTVGNVHEIAQRFDPETRVVYVDNEPVVIAHSEHMLEGNDFATAVHGDLASPGAIMDAAEARGVLDFDQPVAVLMVALLHFISEQQRPTEIVQRFRERMAPGSFLGVSHGTGDDHPEVSTPVVELYENTPNPITLRSREQVIELFSGFEIMEPGVVYVPEWHPDSVEDTWAEPAKSMVYCAVGRKV